MLLGSKNIMRTTFANLVNDQMRSWYVKEAVSLLLLPQRLKASFCGGRDRREGQNGEVRHSGVNEPEISRLEQVQAKIFLAA